MDSASLLMLVEILDAGSLSEAARRLKMTRANVSYHLKQLEADVGSQLIRRTTRQIEPTELGLTLYEHGRQIQEVLRSARESIVVGESPQGRVRLSVPNGYGELVMEPWLIQFKRQYPKIVLDVVFENRITDLIRDEVDVAVRLLAEPPETLDAWKLDDVRITACATPAFAREHGMPDRPEDLRTVPIVTASMLERRLRVAAYQRSSRVEVTLEPTLTSHNFLFLRTAVLADVGLGLVADFLVRDHIARGELVTALDDWRLSMFGHHMYLLTMRSAQRPRALTTLVDYVVAAAARRTDP